MSREIKFSYMWTDGKGWIDNRHYLEEIEGGDHWEIMSDSLLLKRYELKHKRQFTGLTDKNGVEIYEGDVVKHERYMCFPADHYTGDPNESDGEYKRVGHITITTSKGVTLNGKQVFTPDCEIDKVVRRYNDNPHSWGHYAEVIGNIYENPELLGDSK